MNWSAIQYQCSDYAMDLFTMPGAAFQRNEWFRDVLDAWISWHRCESIVKLILNRSRLQVFEQPVQ